MSLGCTVNYNVLKGLLNIAKIMKCKYFYAFKYYADNWRKPISYEGNNNYGDNVFIFGLGADMCTVKTIEFLNNEEIIPMIPIPNIGIMTKDLASIVSEMENKQLMFADIEYDFDINRDYMMKKIIAGECIQPGLSVEESLLKFYSLFPQDVFYNKMNFIPIDNNEEFIKALNLKAKDGLSFINISNQVIPFISSMIGAIKSDKIYFCLSPGLFKEECIVTFKIYRKSKKCNIYTSYKILSLVRY
jgi:hypothetical protein